MFKCNSCNYISDEMSSWTEPHGEKLYGCPKCGGGMREANECKICGNYFTDDELTSGVCEKCKETLFDEYRHDWKSCYKFGIKEPNIVSVNCFLSYVFDADEIDQILLNELKKRYSNIDCKDFIDEAPEWFLNQILEE